VTALDGRLGEALQWAGGPALGGSYGPSLPEGWTRGIADKRGTQNGHYLRTVRRRSARQWHVESLCGATWHLPPRIPNIVASMDDEPLAHECQKCREFAVSLIAARVYLALQAAGS
jgi:hypothetical protein